MGNFERPKSDESYLKGCVNATSKCAKFTQPFDRNCKWHCLLGHVVVQFLPEVFLVAGVVQQQDLLQEVRRGPLHDGVHGPDQGRPGDIGGVRESDNVTNHLL